MEDIDGDSSYLGQATDKAEPWAIIRNGKFAGQFVGELPADAELPSKGREYRFFLPAQHVPHDPENWAHVTGEALDKVVKEHGSIEGADRAYALSDWRRMEALSGGDWAFVGIVAKAQIISPASNVVQIIQSGGLWGIESDSGSKYFDEVATEELCTLAGILQGLGLGGRMIDRAIRSAKRF